MRQLKVLIACEESQAICKAFRALGHEAYSCDIQSVGGGRPEWHIHQDVLPLLNGECSFSTEDGVEHHQVGKWDLVIAHPPCTRLCSSGQRWLFFGTEEYRTEKRKAQQEGIEFFMKFTDIDCDHVAIENPIGIMSTRYRQPDCIYNPYDFEGETECKKTCLWLKNLPPLRPTQNLPKEQRTLGIYKANFEGKQLGWNNPLTAKMRSRTPSGVAKAIAEQWSEYILNQ